MDLEKTIEHLRAAQPHMKAMGDALKSYAKETRTTRLTELVDIADFIGNASLLECKLMMNELTDRVSALTGYTMALVRDETEG